MQSQKRLKNIIPLDHYSAGSSVASDAVDSSLFGTGRIFLNLSAVNGTPASFALAVKIQGSLNGVDFYDLPNGTFKSITAVSGAPVDLTCNIFGYQKIRAVYTLSFVNGTLPTATMSIDAALGVSQPTIVTIADLYGQAAIVDASNEIKTSQ